VRIIGLTDETRPCHKECAFRSPFEGILSVIEILQQLVLLSFSTNVRLR